MPRRLASVRPRALGFRDLRLSVDVQAGVVLVAGTLDRATAHHLSDAVSALRSSPSVVWTLDLSGVTFCDTTGLRVLHRARLLAEGCGRKLHARSPSPALADLLDLVDGLLHGDGHPVPPPVDAG